MWGLGVWFGFNRLVRVGWGMARRLVMTLLNTPPGNASAPIAQAAVAAAMGNDTCVVFTGDSGRIAVNGVAAAEPSADGTGGTLHDVIRDAVEAGVVFRICSPAVARFGDDLIPEIREVVGAAWLIAQMSEPGTVTLTY